MYLHSMNGKKIFPFWQVISMKLSAANMAFLKEILMPDAIGELQKITWTGNIREFRNVVERLIILCPNNIEAKDVIAFRTADFKIKIHIINEFLSFKFLKDSFN